MSRYGVSYWLIRKKSTIAVRESLMISSFCFRLIAKKYRIVILYMRCSWARIVLTMNQEKIMTVGRDTYCYRWLDGQYQYRNRNTIVQVRNSQIAININHSDRSRIFTIKVKNDFNYEFNARRGNVIKSNRPNWHRHLQDISIAWWEVWAEMLTIIN